MPWWTFLLLATGCAPEESIIRKVEVEWYRFDLECYDFEDGVYEGREPLLLESPLYVQRTLFGILPSGDTLSVSAGGEGMADMILHPDGTWDYRIPVCSSTLYTSRMNESAVLQGIILLIGVQGVSAEVETSS
jgi:hypothetical protein